MAWIESHQSLANHPKSRKLARLLGVSRPAIIGHLHLMWWWSLDYAQDGDLSRFDSDELADAMGYEDDRDVLVALIDSGFIDGDGHIHDWLDYTGRLMVRRSANAERMRTARVSHVRDTTPARVELPNRTQPTEPTEQDQPERETVQAPATPTNEPTVQSRNQELADVIVAAGTSTKPRRRATVLPDDWQPTAQAYTDAQNKYGIAPEDVDAEVDQFRNHHLAHGNTMTSWDAAWRTWMGNYRKFSRPANLRQFPANRGFDAIDSVTAAIKAQRYGQMGAAQ